MIVMKLMMCQPSFTFLMVCTHSLPKRCRLESRRQRDGTLRPFLRNCLPTSALENRLHVAYLEISGGVYDDTIYAVAITLAMPVPGQPRVMNSMTWADVAILLLLLLLLLLLRIPAKLTVLF